MLTIEQLNEKIVTEVLTWCCDDVIDKYNLSYQEYDDLEGKCVDWLKINAEPWSDYDEDFPNNLCHYGYELSDGTVLITDYTGIAGKYWNEQGHYSYAMIR
ncbi:hypothetical protein MKC55_21100 [[Clostridium] innocuum]|nr:hypothetical protein [[Clostridium] innocuum]